jgi:crotonobetainyl-CoA:carnitine CoA-transferase CaiB-like acyl-CoA transferase
LLDQLRAAEIPCGPINSVPDTLADPHYVARGNRVTLDHPAAGPVDSLANPVRLADTPASYRLPPPRMGEHTAAILAELGYAGDAIERLRAAGTVG